MDELPSAAFRKQYAKLTKVTVVTVNGHVIGTWTPGGPSVAAVVRSNLEREATAGYSTRPFTPVPKPGRR